MHTRVASSGLQRGWPLHPGVCWGSGSIRNWGFNAAKIIFSSDGHEDWTRLSKTKNDFRLKWFQHTWPHQDRLSKTNGSSFRACAAKFRQHKSLVTKALLWGYFLPLRSSKHLSFSKASWLCTLPCCQVAWQNSLLCPRVPHSPLG